MLRVHPASKRLFLILFEPRRSRMHPKRSPLEEFLWAEGRLDARRQEALDGLRWGSPSSLPPIEVIRLDQDAFALMTGPLFEPERQRRIALPLLGQTPPAPPPRQDVVMALFDGDGHKVGDFPLGGDVGVCRTADGVFRYDGDFRRSSHLPQTRTADGSGLTPAGSTIGPVDLLLGNGDTVFVTQRALGTVYVVDLAAGEVVNRLRMRTSGDVQPMPIAVAGHRLFVALSDDGPLWGYDLRDGRHVNAVDGLGFVTNVVVTPDGRSLWVLASAPKFAVHRVDLESLTVVTSIPLPGEPFSRLGDGGDLMTISPDGSRLLVMSAVADPEPETPVVHVLNLKTGRMVRRVRFRSGRRPARLAFATANPYLMDPKPLEESLVELRIATWEELVTIREMLAMAGAPPDDEPGGAGNLSIEGLAKGTQWRRATIQPAPLLALPAELDTLIAYFLGKLFHEQTGFRPDTLLLKTAREVRQALETATAAEVQVPGHAGGRGLQAVVTREQVAEWRQVLTQIEVSLVESAEDLGLPAAQQPETCPACDSRLQGRTSCTTCGLVVTASQPEPATSPRFLRHKLTQATIDPSLFLPTGHLLLPDPVRQRVVEIDAGGEVIWQVQVERQDPDLSRLLMWPIDALRLANGNTLLLDRMGKDLYEVTPEGRPYWQWPTAAGTLVEPVRVARNEWGDIHVVDRLAHRIRRVDANGTPMGGYGSGEPGIGRNAVFMPSDIHVLLNGHMLITDCGNHRVIEVVDGEVIWQFGNRRNVFQGGDGDGLSALHTPRRALRLPKHQTVILDAGNHRVVSVDGTGTVAWAFDTMGLPHELAMETPHGMQRVGADQLAIWDNRAVVQIDWEGNVVWAALLSALTPGAPMRHLDAEPDPGDGDLPRRLWQVQQVLPDAPVQVALDEERHERIRAVNPIRSAWFDGHRDVVIKLLKDLSVKRLAAVARAKPWRIDLASLQERTAKVRERLKAIARMRLSSEPDVVAPPAPPRRPAAQPAPPPPLPQALAPTPESDRLGLDRPPLLALVVQRNRQRVLLVDRQRDVLWQSGPDLLKTPASAELLGDGHILIVDSGRHRLIEVDPASDRIVWESREDLGLNGPRAAQRLPNGHTLIADTANHRLLEIDGDQQVVWRWSGRDLNTPTALQRLGNGHTLVTDWGWHTVVEIGTDDQVVWSYGQAKRWGSEPGRLHHPESASRLPDGRTLIVDGRNQRVIEVDREGTVGWQAGGLAGPTHARRLVDGATLVTYSGGHFLVELGHAGEVLWRAAIGQEA